MEQVSSRIDHDVSQAMMPITRSIHQNMFVFVAHNFGNNLHRTNNDEAHQQCRRRRWSTF
jgi:hypothetical protein